ncbi:UDP-N-acetylglucosamine--peptide N-acetylglucosaminyltransferase [Tetrabaena socialis]|uniref:UDP-N-acetylglucosamine--peptide N-acetylglucosaminyltransferase n=1 Tax=Tetrabaena socialis TaxID=47790 RepID=A0A2J8AFY0_9CHLO|nr:UDP-N-acetylglucosamine--peptide N-acetylglucosaminyltransferase [Tetrabaena socialis]|eukprot:PNH11406.1 UDP-N-acetylglucosamine--peptide N-acetylglucosaminyltransferase [Tetrabaena socialis]
MAGQHASGRKEAGAPQPEPALKRLLAAASSLVLAAVMLGCPWALPPPASANNVRLEDMESSEMREGLEAATSGQLLKAEVASVWSNLGNVHMSQGRAKQALDDYSHAVALAPYAPVPYLNRAIALEELGLQLEAQGRAEEAGARWLEALADCDSAIQRDSKEFAAWFNKGNVELRLLDYPSALSCFSTAADLAPGIAGYRLRAAQLLFQCGQPEVAVRTVKGVLRKNPTYAEAHTTLAAMLWSQGQVAAAEGQLEAALELGGRWRDADWVAANTRWPPLLTGALERLVVIGDAQPTA